MTEHEPTPVEEAEVTRLLAEAGGQVDMPESVASRLDDVLADLVAERSTPAAVPTRRRRWPQVLVAAAAVSVIGYAGSVLVPQGSSPDEGASSSVDADDGASLREVPPTASTKADEEAADSGGKQRDEASGLPQNLDQIDGLWFSYAAKVPGDSTGSPSKVTRCRVPALAEGERSIEFTTSDGRRAVVVVRPLNGSAARADVYPCRQPLFPVASSLLLAAR